MITKNLKNLTAMLLQASSTLFGALPVVGIDKKTYYLHGTFSYPGTRAETYTLNAEAAGISFGTGSTAPTENDINLEKAVAIGDTSLG